MTQNVSDTSKISKTLSSNDMIKTITTNLMAFQANQVQILYYEYCYFKKIKILEI